MKTMGTNWHRARQNSIVNSLFCLRAYHSKSMPEGTIWNAAHQDLGQFMATLNACVNKMEHTEEQEGFFLFFSLRRKQPRPESKGQCKKC